MTTSLVEEVVVTMAIVRMATVIKVIAQMAVIKTIATEDMTIRAILQAVIAALAKATDTPDSTAAMTVDTTRSTIGLDASGAELVDATLTIDMATVTATDLHFETPIRASLVHRRSHRTPQVHRIEDRWTDHPWASMPRLPRLDVQLPF